MDTPNFIVLMGLGPITIGYCVLITRRHYTCYAELPKKHLNEFQQVLGTVQESQRSIFGASLLFEHGRNGGCLARGHGDDLCYHAHMHLLPTAVNLANAVHADYSSEHMRNWRQLARMYSGSQGSYLLIQDGNSLNYVNNPSALPGRYLRTKAAEQVLGDPTLADWQAFPSYEMVREGKRALKGEIRAMWAKRHRTFSKNFLAEFPLPKDSQGEQFDSAKLRTPTVS